MLRRSEVVGNHLETIDKGSFSSMPSLKYVELFGSKMNCSCTYLRTLRSLNTEFLQADCHNVHGSDQVPNILQSTSYDFDSWVNWEDCETGQCNQGSYMRTALCKSCYQTNSPLCTNHNIQNCLIYISLVQIV